MHDPKTAQDKRSSSKDWRVILRTAVLVCIVVTGVLYVMFTVGTVGYIKHGGSEIRGLCTPDLIGKSISEIRATIDTKAFSVRAAQNYIYIHRLASVSGHCCLVSINESGISTAAKVVFLF